MPEPDAIGAKPAVKADDPHRPIYHFLPEANWLNDPNGLIQWKGRYHLFYQYNPNGAFWGTMHWGHAVSEDLVNWEHLPIALEPSPDGPDRDGCYSGCAVDNNGVPTLIYTGVTGKDELACVATSNDDLLRTWEKYAGNPVIPTLPPDLDLIAYRDHSVWKEGDTWYQVIGAGIKDQGGTALLYRSPDLLTWEYLNPILIGDRNATEPIATGEMWECPSLFIVDNKHVLIISAWENHKLVYSAYFTGDFSDQHFVPQHLAILDNGGCLYAPQTMKDDQGRILLWGWLQERRSGEAQRESGWSGAMSLPRILNVLPDGRLAQSPVPELQKLRAEHQAYSQAAIPAESGTPLSEIKGDCLEILLELERNQAESAGIAVRCAPDGSEQTLISYDWKAGELVVDCTQSSLDPQLPRERRTAACPPDSQGNVRLHIFVDRSVIEVFVNDDVAMSIRIYPTRHDSQGLKLVANGGQAGLKLMDIWTINSAKN